MNCLWNDVLHFSPINPQLILDIYKKENLIPEIRTDEVFETYKIPVTKLIEANTVCFQSFNFDFDKFDTALNKYSQFSRSHYQELLDSL